MQKNVSLQKFICYAFDSTTNLPKTGDAANLTAYVSKDYGSVTVLGDTSATEMDATNAKGYYLFDLTQAETNADTLLFSAKSSTANIVVLGMPATVYTVPANFTKLVIDSSGLADANAVKVGPTGSGTAQTAYDIGGKLGTPAGVSLSADLAAVKAETAEIDAIVDLLPDAGALSSLATATNLAEANADLDELIATLGAAVGVSISADIAAVKAETAEIDAIVDLLPDAGALSSLATATNLAEANADLDELLVGVIVTTNNDKTGYALTSAERNSIADAELDRVDGIEVGLTPRQAQRLNAAASAGKLSGAATTTVAIRNAVADSKARITATVDSDGNRTAITTDVT